MPAMQVVHSNHSTVIVVIHAHAQKYITIALNKLLSKNHYVQSSFVVNSGSIKIIMASNLPIEWLQAITLHEGMI